MESLIDRLRDEQAMAKLIGEAPSFLKAIQPLTAIAKGEANVLISGETGTGKELVARAIHYLSARAAFPFVPVHFGSLPDTLLESELFGHERGAFTDARTHRHGLIAQAEKGTLFLDELETMSSKAQVVLLRVLQDKKFRALGSSREQTADIRVVAATNAPLEQLVQAGAFRSDLYYRLCVFSIHLPPLRERKEDIMALAHHFLRKHTPPDRPELNLAPGVSEALLAYDWPGNVRELESAIIRGIHLSQTNLIEVEDLGIPSAIESLPDIPVTVISSEELSSLKAMKQKMIEEFEKEYLTRLMREHQGNVSRAALAAGKERRELGKLLKKYRIDPGPFRY
ncbi:MAG: sigma-54 dependent transcriptional regulator [candidate division KSB1 bacterium]|nr:sigma-54 dependent transcriptional regulator [candidate division KSB1 bacterium]MDZ7300686.1 sigma-54 dependent transcriptional regulator [candidate division KSB1 bacterium]MDZ7309822.1 sigma-54 dependent transcriptional regulator [candidate division KSB1 bacterium]